MELSDYLRILRAHWLGVLALVVCGVVAAGLYSTSQPKVYEAHATGFVSSGKDADPADASISNSLAQSRVASYVAIATSTATAERVLADPSIQGLGLPTDAGALSGDISVSQPLDTVLIDISARASTPQTAATLANAWVKALSKEVEKVDGKPQPGSSGLRMRAYGSAQLPGAPVLPRTKLNLAIGLLLGALLGVAYALIRNQLDRRLRSSEEVEKTFHVPVIGKIPQTSAARRTGGQLTLAVTSPSDGGGAAESFRKLRTNLAYMDVDNPPRVIVVTSPKQGDGKSTVAANLAAAVAVGGQRVILIDGDLRRPTVADSLGMVDGAGLTDILVGRVKPSEVIQDHPELTGLRVLASGAIPPNPSELLGSHAMQVLLKDLAQDAMVIIDAPPLLPVTDAAVLTQSADGAMMVISHGGTLDTELASSLHHISQVHGRTLGIVFNRMRKGAAGGYYGDYYVGDYQADPGRRKSKSKAKSTDTAKTGRGHSAKA
jgi:capsular exopolysaccharide synthesis family protein